MRFIYLIVLLAFIGATFAIPKESKKKIFKTRSDLPSNETVVVLEVPDRANLTVTEKDKPKETTGKDEQEVEPSKEPAGGETISDIALDSTQEKEPPAEDNKVEGETTVVPLPKPSYLTKVKNLVKRVFEVLGLPWGREKRKGRKMKHDDVIDGLQFVEEMRTAYGALKGKQECMKRAACSAGGYLRQVKGKELLIILLEKFAPAILSEPISYMKEAAIYKDPCDYSCEEDNE